MRLQFEEIKAELKRVLIKKGVEEQRADEVAQMFTEASRDGVYSHGINRFPRLISFIERGIVNIETEATLAQSMGSLEQWDGNLGFGNINAKICMDRAIDLAKANTIGVVALRNTNHWMRGGAYGWQAADAGCIGICWTNTGQIMPAWGAKDSRIGNNPLILAVPREEGHVVVDMAMAQFSYGQLENHRRRGDDLPFAGGYNKNGELTVNPSEIETTGRVLPIGYWKGSGLALLLDLIGTILSGGLSSYEVGKHGADEQGLSQVFIAIDTKKVATNEFLHKAVNDVIDDLKQSSRVDENQEIRYPGEQTLNKRNDNIKNGIPVDEEIWSSILSM